MRLADIAPDLHLLLTRGTDTPSLCSASEVHRQTVWVAMRDGVRLATDLYLPPRLPAPAIAIRSPYGRGRKADSWMAFAQRGYAVIAQDCRGTGDSEPETWDYYVHEPDDSVDLVEWVVGQKWFDNFLGACGASYAAQTQWCMAADPRMSAIAPEVGGLGVTFNTVRYYMFLNAYARTVGKGRGKLPVHFSDMERQMVQETLAGGYFNQPMHKSLPSALLARYPALSTLPAIEGKRWLWKLYCGQGPEQRAQLSKEMLEVSDLTFVEMESLVDFFDHRIAYGAHSIPSVEPDELARRIHAPALLITGWYDWGLNDTLATWEILTRDAREAVRSRTRLLITPSAHNMPGYREGQESHPELQRNFRTENIVDLLLRWYDAVRNETAGTWPTVTYYLMGANEWRVASAWPPPDARTLALYLGPAGTLARSSVEQNSAPGCYTYHPDDPTPTVGGSIVSYVYRPGSVDVSEVQKRQDVLTYTTVAFDRDLDVVGPIRLQLYASSSAIDTDFSARISDVFPDGRAIQLQSGMLRARYRNPNGGPEPLVPGKIYCFEIDLWATANRFKAGHRLRLDLCSADFPRFDRNANLGGTSGEPVPATQTIFHGQDYPSRLILSVLPAACENS